MKISRNAARAVSQLENSVCALLALDLRENDLVQGSLDTALWRLCMRPQGLTSHMWLLAYEADLKGWMQGTPGNFVNQHKYFAVLKARGISFYDTTKNVKHIKKETPPKRSSAFLAFLREMQTGSLATTPDLAALTYF